MSSTQETIPQRPVLLSQIPWKDYLASKNYNQDAEKMCDLCIKDQKKKYGSQSIICKGLATTPDHIKKEYKNVLSPDEFELIEQGYNPYLWAKRNINSRVFKERWYQELMTRCTARNALYRCGRRSGKSFGLVLKALHRMFMKEDTKILMLAPQETQVKEFDEILKSMINAFNPDLLRGDAFLKESRKKPYYEQKYSNRSRFRGIIAANDAKTVRGQPADVIILDEVDYISEEALAAVVAILLDNPNVEMWVASTPAGKKELYKYEQSNEYKVWHFPSYVIPHYNDALDLAMKQKYGDGINYIHEVMAEYGEDEQGVFQSFFMEACKTPPIEMQAKRIDVLKNRANYIVILGIDWNDDKNGTRLMSVAFDRVMKRFFVADKQRVSKEGWTQVEATNKLTELNRLYKYDNIYVDEGFGVSTVQFIKSYAISQYGILDSNHPDLRLANIVGINFSENIELKDVENNQPIKKDMKSYTVENSVRYLERMGFMFDEVYDEDLLKQMNNYKIARRTPSGKAVYQAEKEEIGDHDLDAWMLALLGFNMEWLEVSKMVSPSNIAMVIRRQDPSGEYSETRGLVRGIKPEDKIVSSKFNGLFAVPKEKPKVGYKNAKFFEKYVMQSEKESQLGLHRKIARSKFKEMNHR